MEQINFNEYLRRKAEADINPEEEKQRVEIREILSQEPGFETMTQAEQGWLINEVMELSQDRGSRSEAAAKTEIKEILKLSPFFEKIPLNEQLELINEVYNIYYKGVEIKPNEKEVGEKKLAA